jgi:hypothetical protein
MFRKVVFLICLVGVLSMVGSASAALVAQYEFNGNFNDSSGNGLNGTPNGNAKVENGYLVLDNTAGQPSSYVDLGDNPAYFDITTAITLAAWVIPDIEIAKDKPIVQNGDEVGIKVKSNDTLEMYFHGSNLSWYVTNIPPATVADMFADGKFHHVAGTYDSAVGELKLYVDGLLRATNTSPAVIPIGTLINLSTHPVNIGRDSKNTTRLFTGKIDDVRIYNQALTGAEVMALIPEPATVAMLGLGGLALLRRRK